MHNNYDKYHKFEWRERGNGIMNVVHWGSPVTPLAATDAPPPAACEDSNHNIHYAPQHVPE